MPPRAAHDSTYYSLRCVRRVGRQIRGRLRLSESQGGVSKAEERRPLLMPRRGRCRAVQRDIQVSSNRHLLSTSGSECPHLLLPVQVPHLLPIGGGWGWGDQRESWEGSEEDVTH